MKNTYLNIRYGGHRAKLSVLLTVITGLLCSTQVWASFDLGGKTIYYDNTETQFEHLYLGIGHGSWRDGCRELTKVSGTEFLYTYVMEDGWHDATNWLITDVKWEDCRKEEGFYKFVHLGDDHATMPWDEAFSASYVYSAGPDQEGYTADNKTSQFFSHNPNVEYSTYAVTITNGGNGTVTVKDYDNTDVTSGNSKSYLTVLKVTVTPDAGYVLGSLSIGGTDYTAAARSGEVRHTMTAATAVNVTFRKEPTVLIAEDESTSDDQVTLNGYVEYTGCLAVTEYGFVYGTGTTPTTSDTKVQVGTSVLAGTHYTKTFTGDDGTYYYRAYIIAGGNTYYSTEIRTFTVSVACDVSSVNAQIAGGTSASAQRDESVALTSTTHADVYLWECTSANSASATITNSDKRNASVSASATGTYTFKLKAKCTVDASYAESAVVTLYVCDPATAQTVYLDNHTANVICEGETATATCISQTGYTYSLYHGDDNLGSYTGTGATLTWYNVSGEGTFYVKSSPDAMPQCAVTVGSATQSYNIPTVDITTSPGLSVIGYKDVTLTKAGTSTVDTDLTWEITSNPGEKGYLLNTNRLHYDGRVRKSVVFKGGLDNNAATTYQVTGTGSKTVDITGSTDKKTCSSSGVVTITVSPATETCN